MNTLFELQEPEPVAAVYGLFSHRSGQWVYKAPDHTLTPEALARFNGEIAGVNLEWRPVAERPPIRRYTIRRD